MIEDSTLEKHCLLSQKCGKICAFNLHHTCRYVFLEIKVRPMLRVEPCRTPCVTMP